MRLQTIVAVMVGGLLATAAGAHAQGADMTCALVLTKTDPATVNVAFPDEAAIYWVGAYQQVPGTRLRITGRYPRARYFSFNVYDAALRPIDALADVEIGPDPGSVNPFVAGASRTGERRDYTAFVDFGPVPQHRAPNTLYTGTGQTAAPNTTGTFILRIYVPDKGRDETAGVGLPTVTLEPAGAQGGRPADSPCTNVAKPPVPGINEAIAGSSPPAPPAQATAPGRSTPRWVKFKNLVQVYNRFLTDNPLLDSFAQPASALEDAGGKGGFLSNVHNSYVYTWVNRAYGEVSLTEVRAPTFPDTRPGPSAMPAGQLRYFSLCTNETASQRFVACKTDDQSTIDRYGKVAYVTSTPAARPAWATADCGYTWLPFGPSNASALVLRHMLPDAGFAQAIQRAEPDKEQATMGDYLPSTRYIADGETPPCRSRAHNNGPSLGLPTTKTCKSRRHFTIRLSRRLRSAAIFVAGHKVATLRGRRLRAPIDLRGLPRGTYVVRIVGRTRNGRRVVSTRTYRTCAPDASASRRSRRRS